MNPILREAAARLHNDELAAWKEGGGRIVGLTCSYVPAEIFYAAGILPTRIRGIEVMSAEIGDTYFGPFVCSYPKSVLQLVGEGKYSFLDGVVITPGCDSMRRIDECWRKAGDDYPGIVPPFFFHLAVPHKAVDYSVDFFVGELRRLMAALESHFGVTITDDSLREAIREYNRGRRLLLELESIRQGDPAGISGVDAFTVSIAGTVLPRKRYNALLGEYVDGLKKERPAVRPGKRLMVVGSVSDDISLVELIENTGSVVVAETLCFGVRSEADQVDEEGDPLQNLARRYLSSSDCPRMYGDYLRRLAVLKDKIRAANVDGVILQNIRFCDLHGAENGLYERDLEEMGVPCLRLEREYGKLVETGRMRMRIDAFLERLSKSGVGV
jgi:benzoyl-CoA reductase subunit C